jgi:hypothetical protein
LSAHYLDWLREGFPHRTDTELELICSGNREYRQFTGKGPHDHRKTAMQALFPSRVWHEWREERMKSIQECFEKRIQELCWIGSSNSNKSADMADIVLTMWWTNPELTSIYITSPYETATELGVWAYIIEQFNEAKGHNPKLPGIHRLSDNSIILHQRNPRSFIRLATVDQVGKLVGKKSRQFDQGMLMIVADEMPAFTASAARNFLSVTANLWSVPNLLILIAGNFADVGDGLGSFCDPAETDIPNGYDGFDPDKHFRWRTKRRGLVLRFDGLQSPNVKAGRDIYPFLTTIEYIGKLAEMPGGLQSPAAMRYIRSAPITSTGAFTVTNAERIRAGGCYDDWAWDHHELTTLAFLDPGFGGGDPCVVQKFRLGREQRPSGGTRQVLALWDPPYYIPIQVNKRDENGEIVPVEDQVAIGFRDHCLQNNIPDTRAGYDGSLRAGLGQKMALHWSPRVRAIDSQGPATERPVSAIDNDKDGKAIPWSKKVDRFLSEMWFATASLIDSFQLRGLGLSPKAAQQLAFREWYWQGKNKRAVETKPEYKARLAEQGKMSESPNEADTLVGGVELARQLGLTLAGLQPKGGATDMILGMIRERSMKKAIRQLAHPTLPSGRLHAIRRESFTSSGRLHR